jgi:hypothetical protein
MPWLLCSIFSRIYGRPHRELRAALAALWRLDIAQRQRDPPRDHWGFAELLHWNGRMLSHFRNRCDAGHPIEKTVRLMLPAFLSTSTLDYQGFA